MITSMASLASNSGIDTHSGPKIAARQCQRFAVHSTAVKNTPS